MSIEDLHKASKETERRIKQQFKNWYDKDVSDSNDKAVNKIYTEDDTVCVQSEEILEWLITNEYEVLKLYGIC